MTSFWTCLSTIMILSLVAAVHAMQAGSARPTLVEVWSGGDDGLTQRLRVATENAFKSSPDFKVSSGKKPGTLVVTIPTHVQWKHIGGRTKVFYTVEFASAENQRIGIHKGSCWGDTITKCANQIVQNARIKAFKLR